MGQLVCSACAMPTFLRSLLRRHLDTPGVVIRTGQCVVPPPRFEPTCTCLVNRRSPCPACGPQGPRFIYKIEEGKHGR